MASVRITLLVNLYPDAGFTTSETADAATDFAILGAFEAGNVVDARWEIVDSDEESDPLLSNELVSEGV